MLHLKTIKRNKFTLARNFHVGFTLIAMVALSGCTTTGHMAPIRHGGPQIRPTVNEPPPPALPPSTPPAAVLPSSSQSTTVEVQASPPPEVANSNTTAAMAPAAPARRVALILGPGGARAFAYIGVLREFERRHIPIEAIVGLEWGALPAALYAQEARANDVEWQMLKMKAEVMPRSGLLKSSLEPESVDALNAFIKQAFGEKQTSNSRVHFMCPYTSVSSERTGWANNGKLRDLVSMCVPYPPLYDGRSTRASPFSASDAALALRHQGYTDIVMVNVLGSGSISAPQKFSEPRTTEILWDEIRIANRTTLLQSNWPIDVPLHQMGLSGIDKARELISQGQKAATPVVERIAQSLGLMSAN
jgi:hypothetical protein